MTLQLPVMLACFLLGPSLCPWTSVWSGHLPEPLSDPMFASRQADGRKVLRSSIREFLCSEAMFHLGVPSTRAGACVTSKSTVVRDVFYDGNPRPEPCAVVLRIAPTFLRCHSSRGPVRTRAVAELQETC